MTAKALAHGSNAPVKFPSHFLLKQRGSRILLAVAALIALAATPLAASAFASHQDGAEMRARQGMIVDACRTGATRACGEIARRAPVWTAQRRASADRVLTAFGMLAVAAAMAAGASGFGRRNQENQAAFRTVTTPAE